MEIDLYRNYYLRKRVVKNNKQDEQINPEPIYNGETQANNPSNSDITNNGTDGNGTTLPSRNSSPDDNSQDGSGDGSNILINQGKGKGTDPKFFI